MKKILAALLCVALVCAACCAGAEAKDPYEVFSGEWLEKETQFTVLDVTEQAGGDAWDVEITSPVSHGAWVFRASAEYDAASGTLAYSDGVKYDLVPGEETGEKEAETGLKGTLAPEGTEEAPRLSWNGGEIVFERAPALPAYRYPGDDPIEGAVANALADSEYVKMYRTEPGCVAIPCPVFLRTEMEDETHAKVWGSFWILNYVKRGPVLFCISGGEYPGIILLEQEGGEWRLTGMETAGDGDDYAADIERFANGDKELAERYFAASDLLGEPQREIRTRFIREYAAANDLPVTGYRDYGWDTVPLE